MENTKIVEIKDMGEIKKFRIRLFNAMEGLDFIDKFMSTFKGDASISLKPFLKDLLPLAYLLSEDKEAMALSYDTATVTFKSPLAILDLAKEILEFQMVFTKDSAIFQMLPNTAQNWFQRNNLE